MKKVLLLFCLLPFFGYVHAQRFWEQLGMDINDEVPVSRLAIGAATIAAGQASVDDANIEGNENATLTLVDETTYDLGASTNATVTIADNDLSGGDNNLLWNHLYHAGSGVNPTTELVPGQSYTFRTEGGASAATSITVLTDNLDAASATIRYWNGSQFFVSMTRVGTTTAAFRGQGSRTYDIWRGDIPAQPLGTTVFYRIIIQDGTALAYLKTANGTYVNPLSQHIRGFNNDPDDYSYTVSAPTLSIAATDGAAAEAGTDPGTFRITRTGDSNPALNIAYTISGTATNGTDYTPTLTGTVALAAGQSSVDITITPVDDNAFDAAETVTLTLVDGVDYDLGSPTNATITITDNEPVLGGDNNLLWNQLYHAGSGVNPTTELVPGQAYAFRAEGGTSAPTTITVLTDNLDAASATIRYWNGSQFFVSMTRVGTTTAAFRGQGSRTYDIWRGDIPAQPLGTTVFYRIIIQDGTAFAYLKTANGTYVNPLSQHIRGFNDDPDDYSYTVALPTVSVAAQDPNAAEAGQDPGTFRITRTGATTSALNVSYNISGTATNGTDYTPTLTGTATIPANASFVDITITPEDDNVVEEDETVTLTLTATASYNLGATTSATVTITDNDLAAVMVSPTMLSLNETGETTGNFTVSLNATPPNNVTIQLVFNSAQLQVNTGSGLGSSPQTITLTPANALSGVTVTVKALDDAIDETDPHSETITALSTSSASSLFNNLSVDDVVVSIADNDAAGVTITQSGGSNAVSENGTTDTYTIRLNSQPTSSVTYEISFPASDVTINGDTDGLFATIFNTGNWNTPQTITIAAVNDRALEGNHTATLTHAFLSTDANYNGATARVDGTTNTNNLTVNITDNETGLVEWSLTAASAAEGANNTPSVRLDITADPIGGTPTLEGTINYTLIQTLGTAEAGDIGTVTGGLSFNNVNDLAANVITITHLTDALVEGTETYTYTIVLGASPTGVTVSGTNFTGTITDANTATVALTGSAIISEAVGTHNGVVTLTTSGGATLESALTFPVNLVSNTAVFSGATGDMYLGTSASPVNTTNVTFAAGSGNGATQNVTININDDRTVEASTSSSTGFNTPENFNVTLSTLPSIVSATTSSITVTIDENDFAYITMTPTFTINDVTDIESNTSRTTNVQVRIIANGTGTEQVQDAFTVPVQSASLGLLNDATPGTDFTAISTTVTFPAGSVNNAQQPVPVTIVNDNIDEFYGALSSFNQNREFFDVGFNAPAIRAAYAGVPILIPQSANDNCDGTNGLPNLPGSCRDRSTLIILDNDQANVVVTESGGNTAVVEGGAGDTYTVVLATQPTSNVTVNLSFDQTQVTVNGDTDGATSLIFTVANWATPQNVSVFAVNDVLVEGNPHTSLITQTITSTDLIYNAINPADVTVSITDNDLATIVFANANSNVAETTASHNVTARLDLVTNGSPGGTLSGALTANVDVTLGTAESADFTQTTTQVTFAAGSTNGATQNISFTMANDRLLEGNETFTLGFGTVSGGGSASGSHEVTITDDESGVITFTAASSTAPEGTTPHNVGVQLAISGTGTGNAQVENDVTVAINNTPGTATTPADYTTTSTSVTFASGTNSPISGTVANTIINDALVEATDETFSLGFGAVTGSGSITATGTHTITIDENDSATVTFGPGNDTVSEGVGVFNKTVTLTITSDPAGGTLAEALSIAYGADELSATEPEDFTLVGTTIDFPAGSANGTTIQAQVNIIDDLIDEDAEFFEPKLNNNQAVIASAPNITVTPRGLTTVQILDNDVANITVNPTTVAINEDGPTSQNYTVVLTTQPTANVTINLSFDPLQITVNGDTDGALSLTFTAANWNTAQTVTVLAVDDFITEGNHSITITQTVTSADAKYNVLNPADVTVNITDNDTPGSQVVESSGSTNVSEANVAATDSYTIRLNSRPTQNVTVNIVFDATQISLVADGTTFTTSPATFTIVPDDWNVLQTIEVIAIDDNIDEADPHTTNIIQTFVSTDANYNTAIGGINPADVTVNITDNDTAGASVTESGGSTNVSEANVAIIESYTIRLNSRPTQNVTVNLVFDATQISLVADGTSFTTSPATFIIAPADWNVLQTVEVIAIDDNIVEADPHTTNITQTFTSTDANYNTATGGVNPADVTVNITDNDVAGVTITEASGTANDNSITVVEGGAGSSFNVVLNTQPTADVEVSITFNDTQIRAGLPTPGGTPQILVFTPLNWNIPQTVNVEAVDDLILQNIGSANISLAVGSTDPFYVGAPFQPSQTVVVNIKEDDRPCPATPRLYVDAAKPDGGDGLSWATAFNKLQDALNLACDCNIGTKPDIWVAQGIYYPDEGVVQTNNDRTSTFHLCFGVNLYGGFQGIADDDDLSDADPAKYKTILSGDLQQNDGTDFTNYEDNAFYVVTLDDSGSNMIFDGFIIQGGNAASDDNNGIRGGGGIHIKVTTGDISDLVIRRCILRFNKGIDGGGMFIAGNVEAQIQSSVMESNEAGNNGGGAWIELGIAEQSLVTFANCVFSKNAAVTNIGGGIGNVIAKTAVINCTFDGNTAGVNGGAIANLAPGLESEPPMTFYATTTIANSIFTNHTPAAIFNEQLGSNIATLHIRNSLLEDGIAGIVNNNGTIDDQGGNLTYDAQLPLYFAANDPDGVDNCWRTADDGLALTGGAPAINQGNDASVPAGIMTDIVGNERFISSMVDMGAYELPCVAEAGLLNVTPSDDELVICESTDPGFTFVGEEALLDADYVYAFILTNSSGEIVAFNTNGDFDLATLAPGTYTVYGLSYASFNTPSDVSAYITSKTNISEIQSDDAGLVFCLELTGEAVPGDTNIITVLPKPVVSNQNATLCSEVASNLTLPAGSAEPAATFNITNIQSNGLSASAGNPAEDEGLTANAIADDAWTNTNSNPVEVVYTIVPVSAAGCEGDAFTLTLTIQPEPVGSNLQTAVCSGDVLNINLQNQITNGLAGVTFTYTVSSTNQASVPAAANRTTASAAAITDTYVNNTGQDVTITYTITPISAQGCAGNTFTATVIVDGVTPGTVGNNQTVCVTKKPATLGTTIAASSSATITYKWEMSTEGCEGTFTEITDGVESDTAENLVFTKPLKKTTYFRRRVFSTRDGLQCEVVSNCVTITVLNVDCGQFPWNGN